MAESFSLKYAKITWKNFFQAAGLPGMLLIGRSILLILVQRQRSFEEVATVDASAGIQMGYTLICFAVAMDVMFRDKLAKQILNKTPLKILLIFHLFALLSFFWSVQPSMSLFRAFEAVTYSLLILTTFTELYKNTGTAEMFRWLVHYIVAVIFLSAIGRARLLGLGLFSIDSLMEQQFTSTPYFYLALLLPMAKFSKYLILFISIFSFSNTAYIGMFLGSFALREGSRNIRGVFYIGALALVVTLLYMDTEKILKNTLFYGREGVGLEYTSGRDKIFDLALGAIQEKPITGYGFVAGETYVINRSFKAAINAHNGLASSMMGMGILGALLFVLFFLRLLWFVKKATIPPLVKSAFLGTIILISVHTLGNPGIGSRVYGTWMPAMVAITFIVGFCYVLQKEAKFTAYQNQT